MWTYRPEQLVATPQPIAVADKASVSFLPPTSPPTPTPPVERSAPALPRQEPLQENPPRSKRKRPKSVVKPLALTYLAGLVLGALGSRFLSQPLLEYAQYYAKSALLLHQSTNKSLVFSTGFLSVFVQFSLVLMLGFCVFGCCFIPLFLLVKGAGTGFFLAFVYGQMGVAKGLVFQALVLWLPEVLGCLLTLGLCNCAFAVACSLANGCLGGQPGPVLPRGAKRLLNRYLALCLAGIAPCFVSALLSFLFASFFV